MKRGRATLLTIATLACVACGPPEPAPHPPAPPHGAEAWMDRPYAEWPHIALINQIRYTDADHPTAACGFLIDTGDAVVAATAKHVLRYFKSATMDAAAFGDSLVEWRMFPKNDPSRVTVLGRLLNEDPATPLDDYPRGEDWLLFAVDAPAAGVQPLRPRTTPLAKGETVFVIGWRYPDAGPQRILQGTFVRDDGDGTVLIDVRALTDNTVPGLSGSPVIDASGRVIGLMSSKSGKLQRLAAIDYALAVLAASDLEGTE